jgi:DNA primase
VIEILFEIVNAEKVFSFLVLDGEKDPDEFFLKNGTGSLKSSVEKRILLHEHAWNLWTNGIDFKNPMEMVKLEGHITAILGKNPIPSVQKHYDHFFKNKIYQSKFTKKQRKIIETLPQSLEFSPNEEMAITFLYQYFNSIPEDFTSEFELKFQNQELKEISQEILNGNDVSENITMSNILNRNQCQSLDNKQVPYFYKMLYNSLTLEAIDKEMQENSHNFSKMLFLHKEKQKILQEIDNIKNLFR